MHFTYVALHEVIWCMVVWCTQNAPRRQQLHVAPYPAMQPCQRCVCWLSVDIQKRTVKGSCRFTCKCSKSARQRRIALYSDQQQGCTKAGSGSVCCQCVNCQCIVSVLLCDRFEHSKCMLNAAGSGVDRSVVSMLTVGSVRCQYVDCWIGPLSVCWLLDRSVVSMLTVGSFRCQYVDCWIVPLSVCWLLDRSVVSMLTVGSVRCQYVDCWIGPLSVCWLLDRSVVSMLTVALPCDRFEHSRRMVDGSRVRNGSVC